MVTVNNSRAENQKKVFFLLRQQLTPEQLHVQKLRASSCTSVRLGLSLNRLHWLHDCVSFSLYSFFQVQSIFHYSDKTFFLSNYSPLQNVYSSHGQFLLQHKVPCCRFFGNLLRRYETLNVIVSLPAAQCSPVSLPHLQWIKPPPQSPPPALQQTVINLWWRATFIRYPPV